MLDFCLILIHPRSQLVPQFDQAIQPHRHKHHAQHPEYDTSQCPGEEMRPGQARVFVRPVRGEEEGDEGEEDTGGDEGEETYA
jgi:hypothetical protein